MGACMGTTTVEAVLIMCLLTRLSLSFPSKTLQAASPFHHLFLDGFCTLPTVVLTSSFKNMYSKSLILLKIHK